MHALAGLRPSLLCVVLLMGACTSPTPSRSADRQAPQPTTKRITAAIQGDPSTLSRAINTAGAGRTRGVNEVEELINAGLTTLGERGVRIRQLAEEVPSVEKGSWRVFPDGRMETFWRLKPGAKWLDGTPLTPDDLIFTVQVGQDKDLASLDHAVDLRDRWTEYDPRKATETIEGLGFARGANGIFRDAAGRELSVEVRSTGGDDARGCRARTSCQICASSSSTTTRSAALAGRTCTSASRTTRWSAT